MTDPEYIREALPGLSENVYTILTSRGKVLDLPANQFLLKEGYFVNVIPVVLEGILKVTRRDEDREILLYYINKGESCIMSFSSCISNKASKVFALSETDSKILLISSETLNELIRNFPEINSYFHRLYQHRYEELLDSIDQFVFKKYDDRLIKYLQDKSTKLGKKELRMTHQEIAQDTGTVREVVSRALKKLEKEGKIKLTRNSIQISDDM